MYCKNCGKELSDNALMCPDCGEPVEGARAASTRKKAPKPDRVERDNAHNTVGIAIAGFVVSLICGIFGIVLLSCCVAETYRTVSVSFGSIIMVPAIVGIVLDIYSLCHAKSGFLEKLLSAMGIVWVVISVIYYLVVLAMSLQMV